MALVGLGAFNLAHGKDPRRGNGDSGPEAIPFHLLPAGHPSLLRVQHRLRLAVMGGYTDRDREVCHGLVVFGKRRFGMEKALG